VFQAGVAFPAGRLRESGRMSRRTAMLTAAVLVFVASWCSDHQQPDPERPVLLDHGAAPAPAWSTRPASTWSASGTRRSGGGKDRLRQRRFRLRRRSRSSSCSARLFDESNFELVLILIAAYLLTVVGSPGFLFKDPRRTGGRRRSTRWPRWSTEGGAQLAKNPPATRQYGPMEAIRTGSCR
jgi:hypothetical protein